MNVSEIFEGTKEAFGEINNRQVKNMKFEYDKEVDAAYFCIGHPIKNGEVKKTIELNEDIILGFDKKGKLLGMEILNASEVMNRKVLVEAQHS